MKDKTTDEELMEWIDENKYDNAGFGQELNNVVNVTELKGFAIPLIAKLRNELMAYKSSNANNNSEIERLRESHKDLKRLCREKDEEIANLKQSCEVMDGRVRQMGMDGQVQQGEHELILEERDREIYEQKCLIEAQEVTIDEGQKYINELKDDAVGFAEWIVTEGYSFGKNLKGGGWFCMSTEIPLQTRQLLKKYTDYKIYKKTYKNG